jgi:hypothetical protein
MKFLAFGIKSEAHVFTKGLGEGKIRRASHFMRRTHYNLLLQPEDLRCPLSMNVYVGIVIRNGRLGT